jgi:hypothetical protein
MTLSRRRLLGFAASLALPIQLQRGRKSRAEAAPAVKIVSFDMAEFTGKSTDADAAFAQAVCTENLNPEVVVMESAEDGELF